jgi:hypothetical protein
MKAPTQFRVKRNSLERVPSLFSTTTVAVSPPATSLAALRATSFLEDPLSA